MNLPELHVSPDYMFAYLDYVSEDTSINYITELLNKQRISHGIQWNNIKSCIQKSGETGGPVKQVLAARTDLNSLFIELDGSTQIMSIPSLDLIPSQNESNFYFNENEIIKNLGKEYYFIDPETTRINLRHKEAVRNLRGEFLNLSADKLLKVNEKTFLVEVSEEKVLLTPLKSGYLYINMQNRFDLISPDYLTELKDHYFCAILPVSYGTLELADYYLRCKKRFEITSNTDEARIELLQKIENLKSGEQEVIASGKTPEEGRDGTYEIRLKTDNEKNENTDNIDYRENTKYYEVKKDQILAVKNDFKRAVQGRDIYGKEIFVSSCTDYTLNIGEGINKELKDNIWTYTSKIDGVCFCEGNNLKVMKELVLSGDADLKTGNIRFNGNITVKGKVKDGLTIICGGDLLIGDSVGDHSTLQCKGNLYVKKGIFGKNTRVIVKSSAQIGFIQYAYLRVSMDLIIGHFAYQAHIYCGNTLKVLGKGHKSTETGAVIGGSLNAMESMILHSAGGKNTITHLTAGIDNELMKELNILKKTVPVINQKIVQIQKGLGLDFNDPELQNKIAALPGFRKKEVAQRLLALKKYVTQLNKIKSSIQILNSKYKTKDIHRVNINIQKHVIPIIRFQIMEKKKELKFIENKISNTYETL